MRTRCCGLPAFSWFACCRGGTRYQERRQRLSRTVRVLPIFWVRARRKHRSALPLSVSNRCRQDSAAPIYLLPYLMVAIRHSPRAVTFRLGRQFAPAVGRTAFHTTSSFSLDATGHGCAFGRVLLQTYALDWLISWFWRRLATTTSYPPPHHLR